jgi:carbonic anhydrase
MSHHLYKAGVAAVHASLKNPTTKLIRSNFKRYMQTSYITMGRDNVVNYLQKGPVPVSPPLNPLNSSKADSVEGTRPLSNPFVLHKTSTKQDYLENNRHYVDSINFNHSNQVFQLNGKGQAPHTLWIGCSDSRAGESCLATLPGEIFSHRNIANIVTASDISCQGAIQFAIDVLKVSKIIVCGHTDCGGVWASLSAKKIGGVLDLWLNPVRLIRALNNKELNLLNDDPKAKCKRLSELNVINSVTALKRHPSAAQALKNGEIEVWGMMYDVGTGLLSEVEVPVDDHEDLFHVHDEVDDGEHGH